MYSQYNMSEVVNFFHSWYYQNIYNHTIFQRRRSILKNNHSIRQLAIAIYTVNRHAKTAPDNKELYGLKKMALEKLLSSGNAEKSGYISSTIRNSVSNTRQSSSGVTNSSFIRSRQKMTSIHFPTSDNKILLLAIHKNG